MKIFLIISSFLLILYVLKEPIIKVIKFVCDSFIGEIFKKLGGWIEPLILTLKKVRDEFSSRLNLARIMGSLFLFFITVMLCVLNYHLIFYGMELLLPEERELGAFGFSPAGLASFVIMLAEVAIGFLFLEVLRVTDLFDWHKWTKTNRLIVGVFLIILFLLLVAVEVGSALKRIYEIQESSQDSITGLERLMKELPYWVTGAFAFVIPCLNALSAFSLRDILLLIGFLTFTSLLIPLYILKVIYDKLYYLITHIDDFLEALLTVATFPVELFTGGILYFLIRIKVIRVIPILFIIISLLSSSAISQNISHSYKLVIVLMDISGSFEQYRSRAVEHCLRYLDKASKRSRENPYVLWNGDSLILFPISSESLDRTKSPLVSLVLPVSKTTIETRTFREEKRQTLEETMEKIEKIKRIPSSRTTDIAGAISRIAEIFKSDQYINHQKFLLIYSDMQDTRGRELLKGVSLKDVCIKILYADINERTMNSIENWKKKFLELEAKEVKVYTPDECEVQVDFGFRCGEEIKKEN